MFVHNVHTNECEFLNILSMYLISYQPDEGQLVFTVKPITYYCKNLFESKLGC